MLWNMPLQVTEHVSVNNRAYLCMLRNISLYNQEHISVYYWACLILLMKASYAEKHYGIPVRIPVFACLWIHFAPYTKKKVKKVAEKFGGLQKSAYLCTRLEKQGRLAQLV